MSYAIIETGGKQLRVEPGRFYDIELLPVEPEEKVTIEKVLFVQHNGSVHIGQPLVSGATVVGTVLRHLRDRKIIVYKMRPKKKTRKKQGHRQELTRLMIDSISLNDSVLTDSSAAPEEVPAVETTPSAQETAVETPAPEVTTVEAIHESPLPPPVADEPDAEALAPASGETETQADVETAVADEPDAETLAPDAATDAVETAIAPESEHLTPAPQETAENTSVAAIHESPLSPSVADEPDAETLAPASGATETQADVETVVADEPDAETLAPDAATDAVESAIAPEPEHLTPAPQETPENTAE